MLLSKAAGYDFDKNFMMFLLTDENEAD